MEMPEKELTPEERLLRAIYGSPCSEEAHTVCRGCGQLCLSDQDQILFADLEYSEVYYYKCPECGYLNELVYPKEVEKDVS